MIGWGRFKNFQWDKGNIDKSCEKHGISPNESEEAFLDEKAYVIKDIKHSKKEKRYILIGKTNSKKLLFVVFTMRNKKIRIISARVAGNKERKAYEQS